MIYNRASSDPSGRGVSVQSQEDENRAWCAREGWQVAAVVTDNDRSATRFAVKDREGFRQIGDGLDAGRWGQVDVLVTWASSRNQRRLDGYVELRKLCARHGVRLAYRGRVYDLTVGADRFATGLDALLDERDAEEIRENILSSHRASVAAGKARGSVPYGYRREYLPGSRRMAKQVPDPETAAVVSDIVDDLLAGHSLYAIAKRLNRDRVVTPQGMRAVRAGKEPSGQWTSSMLRNMLTKRSLAGERTHRGVVTGPAEWEPIVEPARWRQVQQLLDGPGRLAYHNGREARWLLSGIAECGPCGAWLRPMRHGGRMTYACAGVSPTAPKGHVSRSTVHLDAAVTVRVVTWLADPQFTADIASASGQSDSSAAQAQLQVQDLERQLAEARQAVLDRVISLSSFGQFESELQRRLEAVRATALSLAPVSRRVLDAAGPDVATHWKQWSLEQRRGIVRDLARIVVHPVRQPGRREFEDESVEISARHSGREAAEPGGE